MKYRACIALALMVLGCGSKSSTDSEKTATAKSRNPSAETTRAAPKQPKKQDPAVELGEIGIAECDSYVAKMRACLDSKKLTPQRSDAVRVGLDQAVQQWHALPAAARAKLAGACSAAMAGAVKTYGPMGCQF